MLLTAGALGLGACSPGTSFSPTAPRDGDSGSPQSQMIPTLQINGQNYNPDSSNNPVITATATSDGQGNVYFTIPTPQSDSGSGVIVSATATPSGNPTAGNDACVATDAGMSGDQLQYSMPATCFRESEQVNISLNADSGGYSFTIPVSVSYILSPAETVDLACQAAVDSGSAQWANASVGPNGTFQTIDDLLATGALDPCVANGGAQAAYDYIQAQIPNAVGDNPSAPLNNTTVRLPVAVDTTGYQNADVVGGKLVKIVTLGSPFPASCGDGLPVVWSIEGSPGIETMDGNYHSDIFRPVGCTDDNVAVASVPGRLDEFQSTKYFIHLPPNTYLDGMLNLMQDFGVTNPSYSKISDIRVLQAHFTADQSLIRNNIKQFDSLGSLTYEAGHAKQAWLVYWYYGNNQYVAPAEMFPVRLDDGRIIQPMTFGDPGGWICADNVPSLAPGSTHGPCYPPAQQ